MYEWGLTPLLLERWLEKVEAMRNLLFHQFTRTYTFPAPLPLVLLQGYSTYLLPGLLSLQNQTDLGLSFPIFSTMAILNEGIILMEDSLAFSSFAAFYHFWFYRTVISNCFSTSHSFTLPCCQILRSFSPRHGSPPCHISNKMDLRFFNRG